MWGTDREERERLIHTAQHMLSSSALHTASIKADHRSHVMYTMQVELPHLDLLVYHFLLGPHSHVYERF